MCVYVRLRNFALLAFLRLEMGAFLGSAKIQAISCAGAIFSSAFSNRPPADECRYLRKPQKRSFASVGDNAPLTLCQQKPDDNGRANPRSPALPAEVPEAPPPGWSISPETDDAARVAQTEGSQDFPARACSETVGDRSPWPFYVSIETLSPASPKGPRVRSSPLNSEFLILSVAI